MPKKKGTQSGTDVAQGKAAPDEAAPASLNGDGAAAEKADADKAAEEQNGAEQAESKADAEQPSAELEAAQRERDEMFEKLQRSQAEFENIRKRLEKEKDGVVRYAAEDTIKSLLPILDDFERAINADGVPDEIKQGLELIHRRIFEVFSRAGLGEIDQHDTFDPNLHFAVDRAPAGEGESDQQILEVYQKGYRFKDRLLRASMVKVAVKE